MGYLLAIDVGKGTEDVMVWDGKSVIENSIQLVLPSNAALMARTLEDVGDDEDVYFFGDTMAGEPWHKRCYELAKLGIIHMTKSAAKSLRYDLDQIIERGVKIIEQKEIPDNGVKIELSDINWPRLDSVLEGSGIGLHEVEKVLICCQDHGDPPHGQGVRDFRMRTVYQNLTKNGRLEDLLLHGDEVPEYLPRHRSVCLAAKRHFEHLGEKDIMVMDSSPAVVLGAMSGMGNELVINVGNGHTVIAFLNNGSVSSIYEMHSGRASSDTIAEDIIRLQRGELTHEKSIEEGGHGVFKVGEIFKGAVIPTIIGPNRSKIEFQHFNAHPAGSMMMAGPVGLLRAYSASSEVPLDLAYP